MSTREQLIKEIWVHCNRTHNEDDYIDLVEMSHEELSEILTDIKLSN
jgi:hypothetical protein